MVNSLVSIPIIGKTSPAALCLPPAATDLGFHNILMGLLYNLYRKQSLSYRNTNEFVLNLRNLGISQLGLFSDGPGTISLLVRYLCSKKSAENEQQQSFAVSYLVNSVGLSSKSAISVYKRAQFTTPDIPDMVLALFRAYGFQSTHISKIISTTPELLVYKPDETLIPKLDFYRSLRLPGYRNGVEIFYSNPYLFQQGAMNFTHMRRNVEVLRLAGMPDDVISYAFRYRPKMFNHSNDHFSAGVNEVLELGFEPSGFFGTKFVKALMGVIDMSKSERERKVEAFKRWGCSDAEISAAFRIFPACMLLSEKKIMSGMEYFVSKMCLKPSYLTRHPWLLRYSLEKRIIPRCPVVRFLQLKGLLEKGLSLYNYITIPEEEFLDMYLIKYKELVPQLFRLYEGKVGLLELGYGPEDIRRMAQFDV